MALLEETLDDSHFNLNECRMSEFPKKNVYVLQVVREYLGLLDFSVSSGAVVYSQFQFLDHQHEQQFGAMCFKFSPVPALRPRAQTCFIARITSDGEPTQMSEWMTGLLARWLLVWLRLGVRGDK